MIYIAISATGFFTLLLFDLFQIRKNITLMRICSIIGYSLVFFSEIYLLLSFKIVYYLPIYLLIKIFFGIIFLILLIYSLFIEIHIKAPSMLNNKRFAISTGTYRLVRHPGFLWFFFLQIILISIYKNKSFIIISLTILFMDLVLIIVEDYIVFPKIFINYREYKKTTPMLIPHFNLLNRN